MENYRIVDRFLEYLKDKKVKPALAERKMNISNGYLSKQKAENSGGTMGGDTLLQMIQAFPDIDIHYIMTGVHSTGKTEENGHIHGTSIGNNNSISIGVQKEEEIKHLQQLIKEKEDQIANMQKHIKLFEDYIENLKQTNVDIKQMFEYLRKLYENAEVNDK